MVTLYRSRFQGPLNEAGNLISDSDLGFGVPYFNTFCLNGTLMK